MTRITAATEMTAWTTSDSMITLKLRYKLAFTAGVLLVATLAIAWLTNRHVISRYGPQIPFDREIWGSADLTPLRLSPRQKMLRDLTTNVLPGKTKDEIEQLLGKSPVRGEWGRSGSDYYLKHLEWDLVYPLGRDQTSDENSPDSDYLTIKLDTSGRFTSWYIKGDQIWPQVAGKKASATYRKITHESASND